MFTIQNFVICLIITIIILLLIKYFFCNEYFTEVSSTNMGIDDYVNKEIYLSANINGKEHYLTIAPKAMCGIAINDLSDCNSTVLILKEFSQYEKDTKLEKEKLINDEKVCNISNKLDCETKLKNKIDNIDQNDITAEMEHKLERLENKIEEKCVDTYESCKKKYVDPSVFILLKVNHFNKKSKKQLYKVMGKLRADGTSTLATISTNGIASKLDMVCFQGQVEGNNYFSSVEFEEAINQNTNSESGPTYRMKFQLTRQLPGGRLFTDNGELVYDDYYVGVCKDTKCNTNDGQKFYRLCLYKSIENPNIIKFSFKIV